MHYSIRIKRSAERELAGIPRPQRQRIVAAIDLLATQPLAGSPLKGGLRGLRRIRVGDHRVVYELLDAELVVLVVRVAHRREAYRRR
ncbi:type II toxin-antitoxin system RelE family toxin [Candidatus Poriferisodalis sp.]|uniref:type II toxin-antitoxin system RelE family toxin n=1 Tax=Candidatus Poriferisodalis sp. TaxID=3101277 RepID=UPI003B518925